MAKISFILLVVSFFINTGYTQERGISFCHKLSWQELLKRAKKENKYIFLDCHTTWCGPCKRMSLNIFPLQEVGDYMNKYFISAKLQMDTTVQDNDEIKAWYKDAEAMAHRYSINVYPTLLYFNPRGELVYKISTSFTDPKTFIASAEIARNPNNSFGKLLGEYNDGNRDTSLLKYLAVAARNEKNRALTIKVSNEYAIEVLKLYNNLKDSSIYKSLAEVVNSLGNDSLAHLFANKYIGSLDKHSLNKENIAYMVRYTTYIDDPGFKIFLDQSEQINATMGQASYNYAIDVLKNIIIKQDEEFVALRSSTNWVPDWQKIQNKLEKKYNALVADKTVGFFKRDFYKQRSQWPEYIESLITYINKYPLSITTSGYNDFAWQVFEHSDNPVDLKIALEWSKKTLIVNGKEEHSNMDTYANILYKLGKKNDAISWEQRAWNIANPENKLVYQKTLEKMRTGEPTWP
ncbi:hypothetical protein A4D02_32865 [Niastella koreensis]|uniref:Thioredoxin domain-containing protein n=2 Tax=Niastella koreensis TaxID=354356 RepID=G8T8P0_NIAKG|nr:thioredoxin family protein [Niastella koreensis]AEW01220.1 Thioredoxin domain-containing protein [Niastella koreensis GR20-10]OQP45985.1 hypothetical protein A4D02_32865 [Niastella koreensis]